MTLVPPKRALVQIEGAQFRSATSEELIQRLASVLNLISLYQFDTQTFFLNGPYGEASVVPVFGLDGLYVVPFDMEIVNYAMFNYVPGTSGTTELDIKRMTTSGGAQTSIFTTTPKITSAAAARTYFQGYDITTTATAQAWAVNATPPTGVTVGTLTSVPFQLNAGDALSIDMITNMAAAQNAGLTLYYRPR